MNKKAHSYMGKFVIDTLDAGDIKCKFFISSEIGNIFPDLKPSFLSVKHNMKNTLNVFEKTLEEVVEQFEKITRLAVFKMGEVFHYLSDYFIYPHNPEIWKGNIIEHNLYELKHRKCLKQYLKNRTFEEDLKDFKFNENINNFDELIDEIKNKHKDYLLEEHNVIIDCKYIVCMIYHLLRWIVKQIFNKDIEKNIKYLTS